MRDENDQGRGGKTHRPLGGLSRRQIMKNAGAFRVVGALMSAYTQSARAAGYRPEEVRGHEA